MKVVFSVAALRGLAEIARHIRKHNPHAARAVSAELRSKARELGEWPLANGVYPPFEREGVRRRAVGNYLILYVVENGQVVVLDLRHGAREPELPG